jgi:glucan phosphoethanolaminetransferase (alkaline phosphatase superfamily)
MAYRNGTYVAFHADGTNLPGESDIDYYNLMKAWTAKTDDGFTMINSHEKSFAVRDSSLRTTLRNSLLERLRNSKNMVLVIGETTRLDTDWFLLRSRWR